MAECSPKPRPSLGDRIGHRAGSVATNKLLPVIATAVEAMKLPLIHWREFLRFGSPAIVVSFLSLLLYQALGGGQKYPQLATLFEFPTAIALIPLAIAWIRMTVNGSASVSHRPIWTFGKPEWSLTGAMAAISILAAVPGLLPLIALVWAGGNTTAIVLIAVASVILFVVGLGVSFRLCMIPIECALQRYRGPQTSWHQTEGQIWRLLGIMILVGLPYSLGAEICSAWLAYLTGLTIWTLILIGTGSALFSLSSVASFGGLALAYKFTAPESEIAADASC